MSAAPFSRARLRAVTREIPAIDDLLEYADALDPTVWARRGDLLVGIGCAASWTGDAADGAAPADPTSAAAQWWRNLVSEADVDDAVGVTGTGLIAFGAMPFDAQSASRAVFTVPEYVLGRRDERSWITRVTARDESDADGPDAVPMPAATAYGPHWSATLGPGTLTPDGYQSAVRSALDALAAGTVSKVVLARDLAGTIPAGSDLRRLVRALSSSYPDTWTFAVDGLIGASPETLVTVSGGAVTARVLAGTIARGADPDADTAASVALATSAKDLDEHQYAVQSVLGALRPHTSALVAQEQPFMLKLPNVWHLATDVEGTLHGGASALDLIGSLHPTAAVAGTPTADAVDLIRVLEPFDRGRYAGPVGWIDADGNGEWAIALRCAQFDLHTRAAEKIAFTAHAGAGIVAGSDPESEMLETRVKFRPIIDALA